MKRTLTKDLKDHVDKEVTIAGWVDVRRDHGKLIFIDLRDRSGKVQMVAIPDSGEVHAIAETVRPEWVVEVKGKVKQRPEKMVNADVQNGELELEMLDMTVLSPASELPFERNAPVNIDTLLDYRPLTLRNDREQAIFKVQHEITRTYGELLTRSDFLEFQAPKIVGGDAEGGASVFHVDYLNDHDAYLATSPQLYKQIMVGVYERVFSIGNVFRAEKHNTTRHTNEYTSLDAEMGFITDHTDVMKVLTDTLRDIFKHLEKTCVNEFTLLNATTPLVPSDIPTLKLRDAQVLISKETGEDCTSEPDLSPENERWLCDYAKETHKSDLIFITHFPLEKVSFYAYEDPEDKGYAKYFDLLFRGVELVSGGQRVHDHDTLVRRIKDKDLDPKNFSFYLQAFKYGMPPHGGWGMGLERLTQKVLELDNVKEATLFPREINRIDSLLSE